MPNITIKDLQNLLEDFATSHGLEKGYDSSFRETPILVSSASFNFERRFFRVWYVSNGQDIILATYNCQCGLQQSELPDCERMVFNLKFQE